LFNIPTSRYVDEWLHLAGCERVVPLPPESTLYCGTDEYGILKGGLTF